MRRRSNAAVDRVALVSAAAPPATGVANTDFFTGHPIELSADFERVVERVFSVDVESEYARLELQLTVGSERAEYGALVSALDVAEDNARMAHKLYVRGRLEKERWEIDQDVVRAGMVSAATAALQQEKDCGARSKQITDADVRLKCAALFADEWKHTELRAMQVRLMVEHLEHLTKLWLSRCASLRTLLDTRRR